MMRAILTAVLPLLACSLGTEPKPGSTLRMPALLEYVGEPRIINAPASGTKGAALTVEFTAYGGGCIGRAENEISLNGLDAQIRSYQHEYFPRAGEGCTSELRIEHHAVSLTFAVAGTARVRVFGRKIPGNSSVVLERLVTIVP